MLSRLGIAITSRCNLACTHCLQFSHPAEDLSEHVFTNIIEAASTQGVQYFALTGGEPTVHPRFLDIIRTLSRHGFNYSLITNGVATDRTLRACAIQPPSHITFSIDGPTPELHDKIRGNGCFHKTHRTMRLVQSAGVPVQIQSTLTRTVLSTLDEMAEFAEVNGAFRLMLALPLPSEGLLHSDNYPRYDELIAARRWVDKRRNADFQVKIALDRRHLALPGEPCSITGPFLEMRELFVNSRGELAICCQMAGFGSGAQDIVADLKKVSFSSAYMKLSGRVADLKKQLQSKILPERRLNHFLCLSCAQILGKLKYLEGIKNPTWTDWSETLRNEKRYSSIRE